MAESEFQLTADVFTEADQKELVGFSCGDSVVAGTCNEWIKGADVLESMSRGTHVWLYRNSKDAIVGFGSVGRCRWRWPLPDGDHTNLVLVPMLGIDERFQGQPPDKEWRYSRQIMDHLIYEAREIASAARKPIEWLLLLVHPNNERAVKLYEAFDFEVIPDVTRGPAGSYVMKHRLAD